MDGPLVGAEPCWHEARRIMAAEADVTWSQDNHMAVKERIFDQMRVGGGIDE